MLFEEGVVVLGAFIRFIVMAALNAKNVVVSVNWRIVKHNVV